MNLPTYERLARVLEAEGLAGLAALARDGQFDDFDDRCRSATPCIDLVNALIHEGRTDLATRAMRGEWDASQEESAAWAARQTGELKQLIDRMNKT